MKQDLLEGAYEGISAFLQDSGLPDVDALVQVGSAPQPSFSTAGV